MGKRITRREFVLRGAGGLALAGLGGAVLGSCGGEGQARLDADEPITIEFWHQHDGALREALIENIERFQRGRPNITVRERFQEGYEEIIQGIQAAGAGGRQLPAAAQVANGYLAYVRDELPHVPIAEAAQRSGGDAGWMEAFPQNILELGRIDGVQLGMPMGLSDPVLFYNAEMFERAGLDRAPRTWDEVREWSRRIVDSEDVPGLGATETENSVFVFEALVRSHGGEVMIREGDAVRCGVDGPEAVGAMRMLTDMVLEDEVAANIETTQALQSFPAGAVGMITVSSAYLSTLQESADFEVGTAVFPTFGDKPRVLGAGGNALVIFNEDERQQLAGPEFIKSMVSPQGMTTYVESTGYVPVRPELAEAPDHLTPYYEEDPARRPALEQADDIAPISEWPENGVEIVQVLYEARQRCLTGEEDPETAMREAAERVNELAR